jgi:hypothetical protein
MNAHKFSILTAVAAATMITPALSIADSASTPANDRSGYSSLPNHGRSPAGAQGRSADTAVAPGALWLEGAPSDTAPSAAAGKTREQVRNEFLNMSAAERQRMREFNRN